MSQLASKIVVLILGALVLIGCQKQGEDAAWERPRMAGEMLDSVKMASGELVATNCIKELMQQEEAGGATVTSDMIKSECGKASTKAVSSESAATAGRNRLFYNNADLRGYYYLPYYINYSYTQDYVSPSYNSTSSSSANDICKLILGVSCKKASKWWNNYFGYDYTTNYQQYNQSYNQGCYSWLNYNYGYSNNYNLYGNNNNGGYSYLWTSPVYDGNTSSSWNNSWYGCYNVYY